MSEKSRSNSSAGSKGSLEVAEHKKVCGVPSSSNASVDGLFNYELSEVIGRGAVAIVYRATCKRGRLRNREVAIKKIPRVSSINSRNPTTASLHSTLYHPSIVSLFSTFSAPSGYYQVLELHQLGTLVDLLHARETHALTETELKGVARTLVDALAYLKKELVLHRDINPFQLMVTERGRVKLSGFGSSIKLANVDSTAVEFCGSANYVSPEILRGEPYGFGADLWSVGCVLITCLSGLPAFYASHPDETYKNICSVEYTLPSSASSEIQDLVASIMQKNPRDRAPLHRILSHPFFTTSLPVTPLGLPTNDISSQRSRQVVSENQPTLALSPRRYPSCLSRDPGRPRPTGSHSKSKQNYVPKRMPLDDITNMYAGQSQDLGGDVSLRAPTTRIVSAPNSLLSPWAPPSPLRADSGNSDTAPGKPNWLSGSRSSAHSLLSTARSDLGGSPQAPSPRTQLRRVLSDSYDLPATRRAVSLPTGRPRLYSRHSEAPQQRISSQATTSTAVSHPRSPIKATSAKAVTSAHSGDGHGRATALSTHRLKPQTHKVSRGQLVVLPSRSLLVDFREGERRKGGKGKEVLVISADGNTIEVHDAPHLSTPCCLAEATAGYSLAHLPQSYLKQYNDAARLVDQLKSRIPKLVHYSDEAKCTLMANSPAADIEILIPGEEDKKSPRQEAVRLRLHQKKGTLEISRYSGNLAGVSGRKDLGEWTKKVVALGPDFALTVEDKVALDDLERLAMRHLSEFLRICHAAEASQAFGKADP